MRKADSILVHGDVVTMDGEKKIIQDGGIAIKNNQIAAVGDSASILADYDAITIIDCSGSAIIPGLINAHTHVPMTLLRGLADDLRLDVWLMGYMMPTEREFVTPEFVRVGSQLGCAEMLRSGVTTFADMYYFEEEVARVAAEIGIRALCGQSILIFPTPDAMSYEEGLARTRKFIEEWVGHPLVIPVVAPHAPYTNTPEVMKAAADLALEFDVPLHIHIAETEQEVKDLREAQGMPVVPWVKKAGVLETKAMAAHCVHIDEGEMRTLSRHGTGVLHNPSSNLKLASGIAPVCKMLDSGINVGIGTDGTASNNDLDMFEEMRLAAFIAKVADVDNYDPTALPAKQAFEMATSMGARALHIGEITGSLEVGKRADIAVVDLTTLHNWPHFRRDPDAIYSQLVYAAKAADVQHVFVNGQLVMRARELLTIDVEEVFEKAADYAHQIDAFLIAREGDVLSKLLAIGELQQEESFEVQVKVALDDPDLVERLLDLPTLQVIKHTHYKQYDSYFRFDGPDKYLLRYREDDSLRTDGTVESVRSRLTLMREEKERQFEDTVVLSHSRYISQATRPLRFYREYFQPVSEITITKERKRWHVLYRDLLIYINLDKLIDPPREGYFLEIKSRTWSIKDAEVKAAAIKELLEILDIPENAISNEDYIELS